MSDPVLEIRFDGSNWRSFAIFDDGTERELEVFEGEDAMFTCLASVLPGEEDVDV